MTNTEKHGNGVSSHSVKRELIVCTAFLGENTLQYNKELNESLREVLKIFQVPFNECQGVWLGEKEDSFICDITHLNTDLKKQLFDIIFQVYSQVAILHLVTHRHGLYKASLVSDGLIQDTGYLRQVKASIAKNNECYTCVNNRYYIVTDTDETRINELQKLGLL